MMKWLRAHSKKIMVVFVLFAMLAFLGSEAMFAMLSPKDRAIPLASAFGKEITNLDLFPAQRDTHTLESIFIPWQYDANRKMTVEHWYILLQEAERAGVVVTDAEVEADIEQQQKYFQQSGNGQNLFDYLRTKRDISPPEVRHAIHSHLMIRKHAENIHMGAVPSEPEVRHYVRDTEEKVSVRMAVLDAENFFNAATPVTPDELTEQFESNKQHFAADSPTGYGYKYPRRVRLQYVVANVGTIQGQLSPSTDELTTYWKSNRAKYQKVAYEAMHPIPASMPEGTPPPEPKRINVEKTFSEARLDVERDVKRRNALQLADQAMRRIASMMSRPWQGVRVDAQTGYKPIPAGVDAPDFMKNIVEQISRELGVKLDYVQTELLKSEDFMTNNDLRGLILSGEGAGGLPINEYAFRVPPFFKHESKSETILSLQLYQTPDAPLSASAYQFADGKMEAVMSRLGLFRMVEAQESAVPATMNEVLASVEHDVQLKKAFARMEPVSQQLYAAALRLGLKPAAELFKSHLKSAINQPTVDSIPFARLSRLPQDKLMDALTNGKPMTMPTNVTGVGSSQEFINACFDMTQEGWRPVPATATGGPELAAATTQPAVIPEPKVAVASLSRMKKIFVVEVREHTPVDETKYDTQYRQTGYFALLAGRAAALRSAWFNPEQVEERCGFKRLSDESAPPSTEGIKPVSAKAAMH